MDTRECPTLSSGARRRGKGAVAACGRALSLAAAVWLLANGMAAGAQSRPWGQWGKIWASAFDAWSLQSVTPVAGPGVYTLQIQPANPPDIAGGPAIRPLATNAPLLLDTGAQQEVATPSAVHCSWSPGSCTVTITLDKAHHAPFAIRSGSAGLQEAINFVPAAGGTIVLDPQWAGTSAMLASATGGPNISIEDQRNGQTTWYGWDGSAFAAQVSVGPEGSTLSPRQSDGVAHASQFPGNSVASKIRSAYSSDLPAVIVAGNLAAGQPTEPWQPSMAVAPGQFVIDANGGIESCTNAGTTGSAPPIWNTIVNGTTVDGSATWSLQSGNVLGQSYLDFRTGTPTSPTTTRNVYPYANIFFPIWDDSAAGSLNSYPFEPLNNNSPIVFGAIINESGGASATGLSVDDEFHWTGGAYSGFSTAASLNCTLQIGDTHGGCWGVNEGVATWSGRQQLFGNEVNLFNDSGTDSYIENGSFTSGPYFGFAATDNGTASGTAGFLAQNNSGFLGEKGWSYGFLAEGAVRDDYVCGVYGALFNPEPTCLWANARGTAGTITSPWAPGHLYPRGSLIRDSNGNVEAAIVGGTSGSSAPAWAGAIGDTAPDGGAVWSQEAIGSTVNWPSVPLRLEATVAHAGGSSPVDGTLQYAPMTNAPDADMGFLLSASNTTGDTNNTISFFDANGWQFQRTGMAALPVSGANADGGDLALAGGSSTGTGNGGAILFQLSPTGTAGSLANPEVTVAALAPVATAPRSAAAVSARYDLGTLHLTSASGIPAYGFGCYSNGSQIIYDPGALPCWNVTEDSSRVHFQVAPAGSAGAAATPSDVMTVDAASGNVTLAKGAGLGAGQTLDVSAGILKQPASYWANGVVIANPTAAGSLALAGGCAPNQYLSAIAGGVPPTCSQPSAASLTNGVTGSGAVVLASALPLAGSVPGSTAPLDANSCGDVVTVSVAGAQTSMVATAASLAAFPASSSGLTVQAAVTAADTVTVGYCNATAASVTPAAATIQVRIIR